VVRAIRQFTLLAACLGLTALAGCAAGATQPAAGGQPSYATSQPVPPPSVMPVPADMNVAAFKALARQEAAAWPLSPLAKAWKAGLVIPSAADLTYDPMADTQPVEDVEALGNGNLVYTGPPPSRYGPAAVVRWSGASAPAPMPVPVLSEAQTFSALKNNALGRCPSCHTTTLTVTNAQPDTMPIATNHGLAVVPAWAFSITGLDTQVLQAAIAPGSYVTEIPARGPAEDLGPLGQPFVGANEVSAVSPDGRTLEMWLANDPCRPPATYGGLVAEVGDVVVVGGWIHDTHPITNCVAGGQGQYVMVRLAKPLGDRVILDAETGLPAPYPFHPAPWASK
jgi:hypothetical protein